MNTAINDSNLAEMVKSSETLAETFRRVHSIRRASGRTSSVDDVIESPRRRSRPTASSTGAALPKTDPHASAATALVSAQVLVESMTNTLARQRPTGHGGLGQRDQPARLDPDDGADGVAADHAPA